MISIIVPVYNAQKYIKRCVESIVGQTYKDWKLILIDDGSTDKSGIICDLLSHKDYRIQVIHTENQGASAARNIGLDEATEEFVTFVDSDDWLEPNHLEILINQSAINIDLCINSFVADLYYGARPHSYPIVRTQNNIESINVFFTKLLLHSQFLWNKLFRRSLISENNIRFDTNINLGEDNIFILEYLNYIKGLSASSICTYHYDQVEENPFSLGRQKRSESEVVYQLKSNCLAILKLYEKYKIGLLYDYASNYYYTRIFERVFLQNISRKNGIVRLPQSPFIYFHELPKLDSRKISNKDIRNFWDELQRGNDVMAKFTLNAYLLKSWLKSKIIKIVVDAKRVYRSAQKIA